MEKRSLSAASSTSSAAEAVHRRHTDGGGPAAARKKKNKPFRSLRKSAARMTGAHGFFSGKKKEPQATLGDEDEADPSSERDSQPLAPSRAPIAEPVPALVPEPAPAKPEAELKAAPGEDEKSVEALPAEAGEPAEAARKERVVLEPVTAVTPLRQDDKNDDLVAESGDASSFSTPRTEASAPVLTTTPAARSRGAQEPQLKEEPVVSPFAAHASQESPHPTAGSVGSELDVNAATILSGSKLSAAIEKIRVFPVVNGCFSHTSDSYEVMLPSQLCRFLTHEDLQTEYISVTHSFEEFTQLNTIISATLSEADSLPELPRAKTSSCVPCSGASSNFDHANRLREYLERLFSLPQEQLAPARAPISAFFGVSDEL